MQRDVTRDRSWGWVCGTQFHGKDSRRPLSRAASLLWRARGSPRRQEGDGRQHVPRSLNLSATPGRQGCSSVSRAGISTGSGLWGERLLLGAADTHDFLLNQRLSPDTAFWSAPRARAWAFVWPCCVFGTSLCDQPSHSPVVTQMMVRGVCSDVHSVKSPRSPPP